MRYHQNACASNKDRGTLSEIYENNSNRLRAMEISSVYFFWYNLAFISHSFFSIHEEFESWCRSYFFLSLFYLIPLLNKVSKDSNGFYLTPSSLTNGAPQAWAIDSISSPFFHSSLGACMRWCFLLMPIPNVQFFPFSHFLRTEEYGNLFRESYTLIGDAISGEKRKFTIRTHTNTHTMKKKDK